MNTLIHLWPGTDNLSDVAILDTPMFPARYYVGPVLSNPDEWLPADHATFRYHRTLAKAFAAAKARGYKVDVQAAIERHESITVLERLAALRSDSAFSEAVSYLPELASVVDHAEAVLKGAPFEVTP